MKAEDYALEKRKKANERRFWRYFLIIKTITTIVIFTLLVIAVWRFLHAMR